MGKSITPTPRKSAQEIIECGWLKDRFGLAWQIVPEIFLDLITNNDDDTRDRVMSAMMKMKKLDIETIKQAAQPKS